MTLINNSIDLIGQSNNLIGAFSDHICIICLDACPNIRPCQCQVRLHLSCLARSLTDWMITEFLTVRSFNFRPYKCIMCRGDMCKYNIWILLALLMSLITICFDIINARKMLIYIVKIFYIAICVLFMVPKCFGIMTSVIHTDMIIT